MLSLLHTYSCLLLLSGRRYDIKMENAALSLPDECGLEMVTGEDVDQVEAILASVGAEQLEYMQVNYCY